MTSAVAFEWDDLAIIHGLDTQKFARFKEIVYRIAEIDPYERRRKILCMRAFVKWVECAPIVRKCNELKRQLQERNATYEVLHNAYLKDVIVVAHHIKNVSQLVKEKLSYDLYDVEAMPLTQIRSVIEQAVKIPQQTSVQFKETLLNAGLIDEELGRAPNPWENSKAYLSYQKRKHADEDVEFAFPRNMRTISMPLKAPDTHRVLIHYCDNCIGMMHLVREWNVDVEVALNAGFNMDVVDRKFAKLKETIEYLKNVIKEQEDDLADVRYRNATLESAKVWMDEFAIKQRLNGTDIDENDAHLREQTARWKNIAGMASADRESTEYNNNLRWAVEFEATKEQAIDLQADIRDGLIVAELERNARHHLEQEFRNAEKMYRNLEADLHAQKEENTWQRDEMDRLRAQMADMAGKHERVQQDYEDRFITMSTVEKKLNVTIAVLESEIEAFKLNQASMLEEIQKKDDRMDNYRAEIRRMREKETANDQLIADMVIVQDNKIAVYVAEADELKAKIAMLEAAVVEAERIRLLTAEQNEIDRANAIKMAIEETKRRMEEKIEEQKQEEIARIEEEKIRKESKYVPKLKIIAIMVKCLVRVLKAFRTYSFRHLGALGLKMILRRDVAAATNAAGAANDNAAQAAAQAAKIKRAMLLEIERLKWQKIDALRYLRKQRQVSNQLASAIFGIRAIAQAINPHVVHPRGAVTSHEVAKAICKGAKAGIEVDTHTLLAIEGKAKLKADPDADENAPAVIILKVDDETKKTGLTEDDLAVDLLTIDETAAKLQQQQSEEAAKQLQNIRKTRVMALMARWRFAAKRLISWMRSAAQTDFGKTTIITPEGEQIVTANGSNWRPFRPINPYVLLTVSARAAEAEQERQKRATGPPGTKEAAMAAAAALKADEEKHRDQRLCTKITAGVVADVRNMESLTHKLRHAVIFLKTIISRLNAEVKQLKEENQKGGEMFKAGRSMLIETIDSLKANLADREATIVRLTAELKAARDAEAAVLNRLDFLHEDYVETRGQLMATREDKASLVLNHQQLEDMILAAADKFALEYTRLTSELRQMNHLEAQLIASKAQEAATVHRVKELEGILRHMHNEHDQNTRSYEQLSTAHDSLNKQFQYLMQTNETLRHAVADSYRSHKTEMERALQAQATDLQLEANSTLLLRMEDDRAVYVKNATKLKTDKRWLPGYTHERDIAHLRPPQGSRPTSAVAIEGKKDRSNSLDQRRDNNVHNSGEQDGDGDDGFRDGMGIDVEGEEREGRSMYPSIAIPSIDMPSQQPSKQTLVDGNKRERAQDRRERDRRHSQGTVERTGNGVAGTLSGAATISADSLRLVMENLKEATATATATRTTGTATGASLNGSLTLDTSSKTAAKTKAKENAKDSMINNANEASLPTINRNNDSNDNNINSNNNNHNNNTLDGSLSAKIKRAQSERIIRNQARDSQEDTSKKGERGETEETKGMVRSYSDVGRGLKEQREGFVQEPIAGMDVCDVGEGVFQDDSQAEEMDDDAEPSVFLELSRDTEDQKHSPTTNSTKKPRPASANPRSSGNHTIKVSIQNHNREQQVAFAQTALANAYLPSMGVKPMSLSDSIGSTSLSLLSQGAQNNANNNNGNHHIIRSSSQKGISGGSSGMEAAHPPVRVIKSAGTSRTTKGQGLGRSPSPPKVVDMVIKDEDGQFYNRQHYTLSSTEVQAQHNLDRQRREQQQQQRLKHNETHHDLHGSSKGDHKGVVSSVPSTPMMKDRYHHDYCDLDLGDDNGLGKLLAPRTTQYSNQNGPNHRDGPEYGWGESNSTTATRAMSSTKFGILKNMPIASTSQPQPQPPNNPVNNINNTTPTLTSRQPLLSDRLAVNQPPPLHGYPHTTITPSSNNNNILPARPKSHNASIPLRGSLLSGTSPLSAAQFQQQIVDLTKQRRMYQPPTHQ